METNDYLTFQKWDHAEGPSELAELLEKNQVPYLLEEAPAVFDPFFTQQSSAREFSIKIQKSDFERVNDLILQSSAQQLEMVEQDHYLFSFTDEELRDVVAKSDEWSKLDFLLARKLLKERGKDVSMEEVESDKKQRLAELAKPETSNKTGIYAGYIFAVLGGVLGFLIGWSLFTMKKTLPDGSRVYAYSTPDRKHGERIMVLGVICFLIVMISKFM